MSHSITTRTGDDGTTSLLYQRRVAKDHPQIAAVGACDELNAALGFAKATCAEASGRAHLEKIQLPLVGLMGELACAEEDATRYLESKFARINDADLALLDVSIAELERTGVDFRGWATPGATLHAAALDLARTAERRAERAVIGLRTHGREVRPLVVHWLNRLSDLLWLLARRAETPPSP